MIIGNKVDKNKKVVSSEEGLSYAKKKGCFFIECSAKTNLGINEAVKDLVEKV